MARPPLREQQVVRSAQRVAVELRAGRLELSGQSRSSIRLRTTTRKRWYDRPLTVHEDGGTLRVAGPRSHARVELGLPPATGVSARLRTGDVTLWGASGALELVTGRGLIAGRDLGADGPSGKGAGALPAGSAATSIVARVEDGTVRIHLRAVPTAVDIVAGGHVALVLPPGTYAVQTEAGAGRPVVEVEQGDGPLLRVVSRAGTVRVVSDAGALPI